MTSPSPRGQYITPRERFRRLADKIAAERGVTRQDILSRDRTKPVAIARHELMTAARELFGWSHLKIGRALGMDESSVREGIRAYRARMAGDVRVAAGLSRDWPYGERS